VLRRAIALGAVVAAVAGCANVSSADLRTSGMVAHITLTVTGGNTVVDVHLGAGGLTDVVLDKGDSLEATAGSSSVVLHHVDILGDDYYGGVLDVGTPGTTVTVALHRTSANTDAPTSTVVLPAAPAIRAPRAGARASRGRDLNVRVAAGSGVLSVAWTGSCILGSKSDGDDSATSLVIPARLILRGPPQHKHKARKACLMKLTTTRSIDGNLDPAYKSGSITAISSSHVTVHSVP